MQVGYRIQSERKTIKLTQDELAALIGCGSNYISRLETGKDKCSEEMLNVMANVFGCTVDYLKYGDELVPPEHLKLYKQILLLSPINVEKAKSYIKYLLYEQIHK